TRSSISSAVGGPMFAKSLLALTPVGAVVLLLIGWAAPTAALSPTPAVVPVSPVQPQERQTEAAALPPALAEKCNELFRATREVLGPTQPARGVAPCPRVAACPPPVPLPDRRCEAPRPRCQTPAPLPCYEPCGPH